MITTLEKEECKENEYCKPSAPKSRQGVCTCKNGYKMNDQHSCVTKGMLVRHIKKLIIQSHFELTTHVGKLVKGTLNLARLAF